MCSACTLSLTSFASFPALMPRLFVDWQLSTREATFVNAAFYAGYVLVSPVLTTLTDRVDARRIVLVSCALGALAAMAFAASGGTLWWAMGARAASGVATAGSFMPGLRALTDRVQVSRQARYVGYYMGCFALGTSLSYAACEALAARLGADLALWCMALGPALAIPFALTLAPLGLPAASQSSWLPNPAPILRNRAAFGLVCCYGLHTWELFTLRSWGVAFLNFAQSAENFRAPFWWAPATVVGLANVLTVPASVFGVGFAERIGRVRWVGSVMVASSLSFGALAWAELLPAPLACMAVLLCGALMGADSATLTSGVVAQVPMHERGLGMAVHTTVGFLGAFAGPLMFGLILDAAGGPSEPLAWTKSFGISGGFTLLAGWLVRASIARRELEQPS
ncbi:MAG: MFS transporter [Myxococcales bacterium]